MIDWAEWATWGMNELPRVAETYAQERGLKFVPKLTLRSAPTLGSGYESVANAIVGPVAGTRDGILYLYSTSVARAGYCFWINPTGDRPPEDRAALDQPINAA